MRLIMLGTGMAMVTKCYNTCFVLADHTGSFMVDGGGGNGIFRQAEAAGVKIAEIRDFFITHKHTDHILGMIWVLRMVTERLHAGWVTGEYRFYGHEEVIRLLGKQGQWITRIAFGEDDRRVVPYRPEDAKSISREITFQEDVDDFTFLRDVLLLLALCVENRAGRVGLHGKGVSLKLTYANMRGITRSRVVSETASAMTIYRETLRLLDQVPREPVRLIGAGIYNLSGEENRQLALEGFFEEEPARREAEQARLLQELGEKYGLDFAGHLPQIFHLDTLHKTVEYMRKKLRRDGARSTG